MSELRLFPHEGWAAAFTLLVDRMALAGLARGLVAAGMHSRIPQPYEVTQDSIDPAIGTAAQLLVTEVLADYRALPHPPAQA